MQCPKCRLEAVISNSKYVIENDTTPDVETKLYIEQEFSCRNPQCTEHGKVIGSNKNPLII